MPSPRGSSVSLSEDDELCLPLSAPALIGAQGKGEKASSSSSSSHTFSSSQSCRPISTQSITSTDSGDSEENYVPMVSLLGSQGPLGLTYLIRHNLSTQQAADLLFYH